MFHFEPRAQTLESCGIKAHVPGIYLKVQMRYSKIDSTGKKVWKQKTEKFLKVIYNHEKHREKEFRDLLQQQASMWITKKSIEFPFAKFKYL